MGKNGTPVRKKARRTIGGGGLEPAALAQMGGVKLRDRFQQVFGQPTTSGNLEWLRKKLAQPLSAHAEAEAGAAAVGAQPSTPIQVRACISRVHALLQGFAVTAVLTTLTLTETDTRCAGAGGAKTLRSPPHTGQPVATGVKRKDSPSSAGQSAKVARSCNEPAHGGAPDTAAASLAEIAAWAALHGQPCDTQGHQQTSNALAGASCQPRVD